MSRRPPPCRWPPGHQLSMRISALQKSGNALQRKPADNRVRRRPNRDFKDEAAPLRCQRLDPVASGRNATHTPMPVPAVFIGGDDKGYPEAEQRFDAALRAASNIALVYATAVTDGPHCTQEWVSVMTCHTVADEASMLRPTRICHGLGPVMTFYPLVCRLGAPTRSISARARAVRAGASAWYQSVPTSR